MTAKAWTPERGDRAEGWPHVAHGPNGERVEFGGFDADFAGDLWQRCRGYCAGRNEAEGASLDPIRECLAGYDRRAVELRRRSKLCREQARLQPRDVDRLQAKAVTYEHAAELLASAIERAEGASDCGHDAKVVFVDSEATCTKCGERRPGMEPGPAHPPECPDCNEETRHACITCFGTGSPGGGS